MAVTKFGVNDALTVKLWARSLAVEALKATEIAPLIGDPDDTDSVISFFRETKKSAGDKITFPLVMQLTGDGVSENETQEGNEESLTTYYDDLLINELSHAVRVKNKGTIDSQRVLLNLRSIARDRLRDWYAKRMSVSFFNQVSGYTLETRAKYYGFNAPTAPSTNRKLFVDAALSGAYNSDDDLGAADVFTLRWIDYAKEKAETTDPMIRPIMVGGEKKYVLYLHPYQITDIRTNTSTGQWLDIQKAAMMGGKNSGNPIYTGALGEYNGVVLRKSFDVKAGISAAGAAVTTVRRAVLLGAQAAAIAFGRDSGITDYEWVEKTFDYDRELGISVQTIFGLTKTVFNSNDFGCMTISSYAAAHG